MKLFKKVMASVLAGVLALSMVACGTVVEPELPEDPGAAAVNNAAVETILKYVNEEVREDLGGKKVVNDENLAKYAQAKLDTGMAYTMGQYESAKEGQAAMTKVLLESGYTPVEGAKFYSLAGSEITSIKTSYADLVYAGDAASNAAAKALAEKLITDDGVAKVGIATKTVGGKTYVLIATAATMS